MKKIALIFILLAGLIAPWACTNNQPTGPLATYNLTATFTYTFTPTATNWGGYTSTATPGAGTNTATPFSTATRIPPTITPTPTNTFTITPLPSSPTPLVNGSAWTTNAAPNGVAYNSSGSATVYVAEGDEEDTGNVNGQIQMFNASGVAQGSPITTYSGTSAFGQPNGVAYSTSTTYIYVVDQVNNAVYEINPSGPSLINVVTSWTAPVGAPSGAPTAFSGPQGIAVNAAGTTVYVADSNNNYIEVFDSSLNIKGEFGGAVTLNNPDAVAVDGSGNIYVADADTPYADNNQRIQTFTSGFSYSSQFSIGGNSDILGISLDSTPNIYIADSGTGQVEVYSSAGVFLTSGLGISPAKSPSPDGLVFIGSNLLVSDYSNNQLYLVTP